MALFYKTYRMTIAERMAAGDLELLKNLENAKFAKTKNQYLIAWHVPDEINVLPPKHPSNVACVTLLGCDSIDEAVEYIESGEYEKDSNRVINLFISNKETGAWE